MNVNRMIYNKDEDSYGEPTISNHLRPLRGSVFMIAVEKEREGAD